MTGADRPLPEPAARAGEPAGAANASSPPLPWRQRGGLRVAAAVFALLLVPAAIGDRLIRAAAQEEERALVLERLAPYAHALSLAVDRRAAVLVGLKAFLEVRWGAPAFDRDFDAFAAAEESSTAGIRTLQYVVRGVVQRTWPRDGNDGIVGFDLRRHKDPLVWRDLQRAEKTSAMVLTGPIELAQGGQGLLARIAVRDGAGALVCVATAVLDLAPLLLEAQLDAAPGLALTLTDERDRVLSGPPPAEGGQLARVGVTLPDRRWQLSARPAGGWGKDSSRRLFAYRARALLLGLLLATLAGLVTARRAARQRLREEQARHLDDERFARLYQLIPDGVVLSRLADGAFIETNETFQALTGYGREELLGQTSLGLGLWVEPEQRARLGESLRQAGFVRNLQTRLRRKDGSVLDVDCSYRLFDLQGVRCTLGIIRDVTEARSLQLKLLQAQKMEAIGTLAGGLAHDFNNIISVIQSYAELAADGLPQGALAREDLRQIGNASTRAAALVRQLLAFSRRQVVQARPVDVSAQAALTLQLLERVLPSHIRVTASLAGALPPVLMDPGQLEQVLMNLALNARDAMPKGGTLAVETAREGEDVVLSVRDTGKGIPEELQARIFEPFFTTKEQGKGSGLGLATCYGIVKQAGGRIELRTAENQGCTFRVLLPAMPGATAPLPAPPPLAAPVGGTETVLLAEDEPQVRAATARMLAGLGYRVLPAADGFEALALARGAGVQLLITDVMMPGMRGPELAERLRQELPAVRTLFLSGYVDQAELEPARRGGAGFLGKPFTLAQLAAAVRALLDPR